MEDFEDFFEYMEVLEEELEDEMRDTRLPKRYIRNTPDPRDFYSESDFRERFRFSVAVVTDVILPLISEQLHKNDNRGLPISPLIQLLIALRFYATGNFQGVSQSSASIITKRVSILLAERLPDFINFPKLEAGQRQNMVLFREIAGFPSVSGCIDCTHIPIKNPGGENAEVFRNKMGHFTVKVQVVTGPNMEIMDIVVRDPGSSHKSVIFDRSSVRVQFEEKIVRGLLLGDNGYACRPYLLTPLTHPRNNQEANYNRAHKSTRNLVERVFGVWKRRFPCLNKGLRTKLNTTPDIICATAVLHNIGIQQRDAVGEDVPLEDIDNIMNLNVPGNDVGLAFRSQFINANF